MKSYRELDVYQRSLQFVYLVYRFCKKFPSDEVFGLTSQLRRATVSIPANIAEGAQRQTTKEFLQFLHIAYGSCSEVETYLLIAKELKYITQQEFDTAFDEQNIIQRQLNRLIQTIKVKTSH